MMKIRYAVAVLLLCGIAYGVGRAQSMVFVPQGFVTGNQYRQLPIRERLAYTTGLIDGLLLSPAFGAPRSHTAWIGECIHGMQNPQIQAMFDRQLEAKPEQWHGGANIIMKDALLNRCPNAPKQ